MLELAGVSVHAGAFRLHPLSLTVASGECHVVLGPSGSGKTTLLETLIGFRTLDSGALRLDDADLTGMPVEKRGVGYVPQRLALFPHLSVQDNIHYGLRARGIRSRRHLELAASLVEATGIAPLLQRRPENLSGGERQRVALVRALASAPKVLLLDEPFSALNEGLRRELWGLLRQLQSRHGFTVLMITHDLDEAFFLGDQVSVLIGGRLRQSGPKLAVYRHPADVAVARFFGIRNLFPARVEQSGPADAWLSCATLGARVHLATPEPVATGTPLTLGIRAEHVMIMRPERLPAGQDNLIRGTLTDAFDRGASVSALFRPAQGEARVEIELPGYAAAKLGLRKGQQATVILPRERLFLLEN